MAESAIDIKNNFASLVMTRLKNDILNGYFVPGEKLLMSRLKERYHVGISPLREALSQLIIEQLVVVENQRGFKVHPISLAEMLDIYQTRAEIEALCLGLALEHGDDEWEAGIVAAAHKLQKYQDFVEQDPQEWELRHQAFHRAIASGCNSPALLQVRQSLYEKASRYRNLWLNNTLSNQSEFEANHQQHSELVAVLMARDRVKAKALIKDHLLSPSRALADDWSKFSTS